MPLKLEGLRLWPVNGFPYLIFYIERETQVDVWRAACAARHSSVDGPCADHRAADPQEQVTKHFTCRIFAS